MQNSFVTIFMAIGLLLPTDALPSAIDVERAFGHQFLISENGDGINRDLKIDGRKYLTDSIIYFQEIAIVSGVPILLGHSSNGGNACDEQPFVISLADGQNPKIDGPLENCRPVSVSIFKEHIEFTTTNSPGKGAERWIWSVRDGLKLSSTIPFAAESGTDWDAIRERAFDHPADVFKNEKISDALRLLLGEKFSEYQDIIIGTGSGEYVGNDYVGKSCTAHMCGEQEALLFLSQQDQSVFAAWKPVDEKIIVFPAINKWPEKPRLQLRIWADKWK